MAGNFIDLEAKISILNCFFELNGLLASLIQSIENCNDTVLVTNTKKIHLSINPSATSWF
jgi:hypothetical protein